MDQLAGRLAAALDSLSPGLAKNLGTGATDAQLDSLEATLGVKLPDEVRAFYRIYNGQDPDGPGLFDCTELLSTDRIADEWTVWKGLLDGGDFAGITCEPSPGVKSDWWSAEWIPITYDGSGNHVSLDLDPAAGAPSAPGSRTTARGSKPVSSSSTRTTTSRS